MSNASLDYAAMLPLVRINCRRRGQVSLTWLECAKGGFSISVRCDYQTITKSTSLDTLSKNGETEEVFAAHLSCRRLCYLVAPKSFSCGMD